MDSCCAAAAGPASSPLAFFAAPCQLVSKCAGSTLELECGTLGSVVYFKAKDASDGNAIRDGLKALLAEYTRFTLYSRLIYHDSNLFYLADEDECDETRKILEQAWFSYVKKSGR